MEISPDNKNVQEINVKLLERESTSGRNKARNDKHDVASYENCYYPREIFDGNLLLESFSRAKKGSDWKYRVQDFEKDYLLGLREIQEELMNQKYVFLPPSSFVLSERGKTRQITGEQIHDRIGKHALCDEYLMPLIKPYLIYDNGASIRGKGIDFTRRRLDRHLRGYYNDHKSNNGYILLIDFTKYYDNIRHDILKEQFAKLVDNEYVLGFLNRIIDNSQVDVSYMDDEEYEHCLDNVFNSLEYNKIPDELKIGEKFMPKHMNIGDQLSQIAGVSYPIRFDNYIKIVKGIKYYGRYMDDSYIIHEDKEYLKQLLEELIEIAKSLGITVNRRKTKICKLSEHWKFLQTKYFLTDTGKIVKRINPKRLTTMRHKLKSLAGQLSLEDFDNLYRSWFRNYYKIMSKKQRNNLEQLYKQLRRSCYE